MKKAWSGLLHIYSIRKKGIPFIMTMIVGIPFYRSSYTKSSIKNSHNLRFETHFNAI